jgi:hypothetical protein
MRQLIFSASLLGIILPGVAAAKGPPIVPPPKVLDLSAVREKLDVFTDGKGHYFATRLPPAVKATKLKEHFYYSANGKVFYKQSITSLGGGKTFVGATISDPRAVFGINSHFKYRDEKASYKCDERKTQLIALTHDKGQAMLKKAKFYDVYWTRVPHALARDNDGNYYYVDRLYTRELVARGYRGFRVFVGQRGKMKRVKMKNVVSDQRGEVFITKSGKLRLILTSSRTNPKPPKAVWLTGRKDRKRTDLVTVPVTHPRTRRMIFRELGVYQGVRLHKPCDDL